MHLLQGGAAKSGNLWLYKIIEQIFRRSGIDRISFVQSQSIYPIAQNWPLSYPEQADIDMLDIVSEQCYWRISTVFRMPIEDIEGYISRSNHVWTHSRICDRSLDVYPLFDKIVYIVRDPRDRAISESKFAFSDYMQRFSPCAEETFEEYLENNLEQMMSRWRWHVYDHLKYAEELDIHVVFYERLLHEFQEELDKLLNYLGVELSLRDREEIARNVDFSSMKRENPEHLRKGETGEWEKHFSNSQTKRAHSIIEPLVSHLGYNSGLPGLHNHLDKEFLRENLDEVGQETAPADL